MSVHVPLSNPGVVIPPPLFFLAGIVAGWLLDKYIVQLPLPRMNSGVFALAVVVLTIGALLVAWGMVTFRRAGTAIHPRHSASRLVVSGPYRFTRNPMYTGLSIVYIAVSAMMGTAWPLILLPLILFIVFRFVIQREERYLEDAFGSEYTEWCARVGRWL